VQVKDFTAKKRKIVSRETFHRAEKQRKSILFRCVQAACRTHLLTAASGRDCRSSGSVVTSILWRSLGICVRPQMRSRTDG
jgi:hypothetical protein